MSIRIGNTIVAGMPEKALRGVGDIFTTANKGVIAGAVDANGGEYNLADYNSGADSVASKLAAGTLPYVSKSEFATQVANTGACGSFGWNGAGEALYAWTYSDSAGMTDILYTKTATPTANDQLYNSDGSAASSKYSITDVASNYTSITVIFSSQGELVECPRTQASDVTVGADSTFLVPKLNPWHVGKNAPVVGNGTTLGLTDGTNNLGFWNSDEAGAPIQGYRGLYGQPLGSTNAGAANQVNKSIGVTTDPDKSGVVVDLSETTALRVMVQLATGATDQALETCTSVLSDVSALKDHRVVEFMEPTSTNNYTWYRKYADGWVEQGGMLSGAAATVTFPIEMANTNYNIFAQWNGGKASTFYASDQGISNITTTGFTTNGPEDGNIKQRNWQVSGMAQE